MERRTPERGGEQEREQKVEGKVFVSQYINGSRESNCNVNLKSYNVLSANDQDLVNILVSLGETEINISHINENSNDMSNTKLDGSITTDEDSINMVTSMDEGGIMGFLVLRLFLISVIKFLQKLK